MCPNSCWTPPAPRTAGDPGSSGHARTDSPSNGWTRRGWRDKDYRRDANTSPPPPPPPPPGRWCFSYRVRFRRNISLISGCVKFTSPFLDMLRTRSLWSSMCRSMSSGGVRRRRRRGALGSGGGRLPGCEVSFKGENTGPGRCKRRLPLRSSHKAKKTSDAIWLSTTVYSSNGTRPLLLKLQRVISL